MIDEPKKAECRLQIMVFFHKPPIFLFTQVNFLKKSFTNRG